MSLTFCGVEATLGPAAVLGVVVHEHVLGEGERVAVVQAVGRGHRHLEAPHVARVAGVLQAVLVALQEELEGVAAREEKRGRSQLWTPNKVKQEVNGPLDLRRKGE